VLWVPGDRGACWLPPDDPLLGPPLRVAHFGLARLPPSAAAEGSDFATAPAAAAAGPAAGAAGVGGGGAGAGGGGGCHRPGRDVVAAPYYQAGEALMRNGSFPGASPSAPRAGPLLFFAGDVRPADKTYSGGARQVGFRGGGRPGSRRALPGWPYLSRRRGPLPLPACPPGP
jgi:hypothetical protein